MEPLMNTPRTHRAAAFIAALLLTFTSVQLLAGYALPAGHGPAAVVIAAR